QTSTLLSKPARLIVPPGAASSCSRLTWTSARSLPSWLGVGMYRSKISCATGTSAGWATQVPSWPALTSRSLSARTLSSAASFAASSPLIGICAAMPPIAMAAQRFQVGKNVIPATAVEADDATAQRVQDLVHLERGRQGLDQHRGLHRAARQLQFGLGGAHHVFPQRGLFHRLQLGQVEVRAAVALVQRACVVEHEQAEV